MANSIWVKVADPKAQFYQEVVDDETGDIIPEHVRAETVNGRQVAVPLEVTSTVQLQSALMERDAATGKPRIVEVTKKELQAHLETSPPAVAEPKAESKGGKA